MPSRLTDIEIKRVIDRQLFHLDSDFLKKQGEHNLIFDDLPVGIQINNIDGSCSYLNITSEKFLGYTVEEIQALGTNYNKQIIYDFNDLKIIGNKIRELYNRNDTGEIMGTFQRIVPKGRKDYEWVYVTSKLRKKKDSEYAHERIVVACPIKNMGNMAHKTEKMLDENFYFRKYFKQFACLTKREKEILVMIVFGMNNPAIADKLFISRDTVAQHRKNINRKLQFKSYYEIIKFAEVFELI